MPCSSNSKTILLITLAIFLTNCSQMTKTNYIITSEKTQQRENQNQINPISRRFHLSKTQNYELERKFFEIVDESYNETYNRFNLNFNYSITPEGVIYSYSEVTITCIPSTKTSDAERFNQNCSYFFSLIEKRLSKFLGAEK